MLIQGRAHSKRTDLLIRRANSDRDLTSGFVHNNYTYMEARREIPQLLQQKPSTAVQRETEELQLQPTATKKLSRDKMKADRVVPRLRLFEAAAGAAKDKPASRFETSPLTQSIIRSGGAGSLTERFTSRSNHIRAPPGPGNSLFVPIVTKVNEELKGNQFVQDRKNRIQAPPIVNLEGTNQSMEYYNNNGTSYEGPQHNSRMQHHAQDTFLSNLLSQSRNKASVGGTLYMSPSPPEQKNSSAQLLRFNVERFCSGNTVNNEESERGSTRLQGSRNIHKHIDENYHSPQRGGFLDSMHSDYQYLKKKMHEEWTQVRKASKKSYSQEGVAGLLSNVQSRRSSKAPHVALLNNKPQENPRWGHYGISGGGTVKQVHQQGGQHQRSRSTQSILPGEQAVTQPVEQAVDELMRSQVHDLSLQDRKLRLTQFFMSRKINAARKREKYRQLAVFYHPDKNLNSGIDYARDLFQFLQTMKKFFVSDELSSKTPRNLAQQQNQGGGASTRTHTNSNNIGVSANLAYSGALLSETPSRPSTILKNLSPHQIPSNFSQAVHFSDLTDQEN